ncbi:ABC transporter permease [Streptomyces vinaceus]|uniref:ABC transporter permease n=1 Tax=Streptomyces vinaceus TaxID=1960 RepID=UPI0035E224E4
MFRIALRSVTAHWGRLLMTVLSVVLGVAFVSGASVFGDTLASAYTQGAHTAHADVVVSPAYGHPSPRAIPDLPENLRARMAELPGVAAARADIGGPVAVSTRNGGLLGNAGLNSQAYVPGQDGTDPRYPMAAGRAPRDGHEFALSRAATALGGYEIGDTVRLSVDGTVHPYTLVGEFGPVAGADPGSSITGPASTFSSAPVEVLFDRSTAQHLFLMPDRISAIDLTAAPGTSQDQLLDQVRKALPADGSATAQTGRDLDAIQAAQAAAGSETLRYALLGFAWTALLVAGFSIVNTFQMLISQRTREIALLRAVGATRRQVVRSVRAEALVIGAVASAAGCALGTVVAPSLHEILTAAGTDLPWGPLVVTPATIISALVTGVVVTLLGAWIPARRAARIAPVAALRAIAAPESRGRQTVRSVLGVLCTAAAAYTIREGIGAGGGMGMKYIALALPFVLAAVVLLAPALAGPVIAVVSPALRHLGGAVGVLAGRNAVRNPQRTGATAAAMAVAVMMVTALPVLASSLHNDLTHKTTDGMTADYRVAMAIPAGLDTRVAASLADTPGVTAVSALQNGTLSVGGQVRGVTGIDPASVGRVLDIRPQSGSIAALSNPGTVAVQTELARENDWTTGSRIPVVFGDGQSTTLTVSAVFPSNRFLTDFLVPTATLARHADGRLQDSAILVNTEGGATPATSERLASALGNNPALVVKDKQQITEQSSGQLGVLVKVIYGLLAMTVAMAVLSVANTVMMSVSERTGEIGMLRAIGQSRSGIIRMVQTEAALLALCGVVLGASCGVGLAWAVCAASGMPLALPWAALAAVLPAAVLVSLGAAAWPSQRAAATEPLQAVGQGA